MRRLNAAVLALLGAMSMPVSIGSQSSRRTAEVARLGAPDLAQPQGWAERMADASEFRRRASVGPNTISQAKRRTLRRRTGGRW
jgi:hypothetical protein